MIYISETKANLIATKREKKQRGVMVMDIDTKEFKCIYNLTNGSSSLALDLSYKVVYVANDKRIIKLTMPSETEQLLYDDPYSVKEENRFKNITFIKGLNSSVGTIALDLRLKHRFIYWSQVPLLPHPLSILCVCLKPLSMNSLASSANGMVAYSKPVWTT